MSVTKAQRDAVVIIARAYAGMLYKWDGDVLEEGGTDCSGGAQLVLCRALIEPWASRFPKRLDMTADRLWRECERVEGDAWPWPGDLAFFGNEKGAYHVVVVTETDGARITEAYGMSRGYRNLTDPKEAKRIEAWWKRQTRVQDRSDFLGCCRPHLVN